MLVQFSKATFEWIELRLEMNWESDLRWWFIWAEEMKHVKRGWRGKMVFMGWKIVENLSYQKE